MLESFQNWQFQKVINLCLTKVRIMMSLIMNINDANNGIDDHISNDYELRVKLGHPKCTSTSPFIHQ